VVSRAMRRDAATGLAQVLLSITFLAFHAFDTAHAIGVTLVRLVITRRRLLEWETAATAAARATGLSGQQALRRFFADMVSSPIIAVLIAVALVALGGSALPAAAPFLLLWTA